MTKDILLIILMICFWSGVCVYHLYEWYKRITDEYNKRIDKLSEDFLKESYKLDEIEMRLYDLEMREEDDL